MLTFGVVCQLKMASDSGLTVDTEMRTSLSDVYAAGDVCTADWTHCATWFQVRLPPLGVEKYSPLIVSDLPSTYLGWRAGADEVVEPGQANGMLCCTVHGCTHR